MANINSLRALLRTALAAMGIAALAAGGATADNVGGGQRTYAVGELLVSVPRGTTRAQVDAAAATINATVVASWNAVDSARSLDAYHLRIAGNPADQVTLAAVDKLKTNAIIRYAGVNYMDRPLGAAATLPPNDAYWSNQWDKVYMGAPTAWAIESGSANVVCVIVDSGVDTTHPDLMPKLITGYNSFTKTPNGRPNTTPADAAYEHGTHVAGIAAAQGNNQIGVAGVAMDNVAILPICSTETDGLFHSADVIEACQYIMRQMQANAGKRYVVNMSFGGPRLNDVPDLSDPQNAAILALADAGAVVCIAAGNSYTQLNPPIGPANLAQLHNNIICVAAHGPTGTHAPYSSARPYTTITAPGGDQSSAASDGIYSTVPLDSAPAPTVVGYDFFQGTSMASPQVCGAAALLLSLPNVAPGDIKQLLKDTATPVPNETIPSDKYGYGILNLGAAMLKAAVQVTVTAPQGTGGKANQTQQTTPPAPVETLRPIIRVNALQVTPDKLTITVDGQTVSNLAGRVDPASITSYITGAGGSRTPNRYDIVIDDMYLNPGQHTILVNGVRPPSQTVTDTRTFTVRPHEVQRGRSLVSIPYLQTVPSIATPEYYFGAQFRLTRWVIGDPANPTGTYHFYSGPDHPDALASFSPPDMATRQDVTGNSVNPLGVAFWADTVTTTPIVTQGQPVTTQPIIVPLKGAAVAGTVGWNMVGDPFPFDVPFNSLMIDGPDGRITINDAAIRGYIIPTIYSYDGSTGYTFRTLPDGALKAWQGHWIGVLTTQNLSLVIPPNQVGRSASVAPALGTGRAAWSLRLSAAAGEQRDTYNFIGVGSRAYVTPKPPMVSPFVTVAVVPSGTSRYASLAEDVRGGSSGKQTWKLAVNTDIANQDVTLSWSGGATIPRDTKVTVKDDATGQVIDMRSRSAFSFNSGSQPGVRSFTVTSGPSTGNFVRVTNVAVQRGRGAGATIGFTLTGDASYDVRVLSPTGAVVSTVASRAAAAGDVHVNWTGRDSQGRSVPIGTYLVQIRAVSQDGDVAKVVQPLIVVR